MLRDAGFCCQRTKNREKNCNFNLKFRFRKSTMGSAHRCSISKVWSRTFRSRNFVSVLNFLNPKLLKWKLWELKDPERLAQSLRDRLSERVSKEYRIRLSLGKNKTIGQLARLIWRSAFRAGQVAWPSGLTAEANEVDRVQLSQPNWVQLL